MTDTGADTRITGHVRDVVDQTAACDSATDAAECVVDASLDILGADAAIICTIEDGVLRPLGANAPHLYGGPLLSTDEGIAGRTVQEDRTLVIDDLSTHPAAAPTDSTFQSVLSIPLDDGVFQALGTETAAFDEHDRERGELLASIFAHAHKRVQHEATADRERDRFAALFENLPDPALQYVVEDDALVIDRVNTAFVRVFGYDAQEVVGDPIQTHIVPADATGDQPESKHHGTEFVDREVERQTATGPHPFLLRRVPIDTESGYCIYADISELKQREQELERQNELLDQFASIVSHDLRNPLGVAQGFIDMVEEDEYTRKVSNALDRMEEIIDDVLTMARQGRDDEGAEPIELDSLAQAAWKNVSPEQASLTVEGELCLEASPGRLQQIFENLFRNALEHGDAETLTVGPLQTEQPRTTGFYVADDGVGIPPEEREHVLEPGYSNDGGHGLGLAIVTLLAESFGWDVSVGESQTGGARFEFRNVTPCENAGGAQ